MTTIYGRYLFDASEFHVAETVLDDTSQTVRHNHDFYEFFILKSGAMRHLINEKAEMLYPGVLHFVEPSDIHCFAKVKTSAAHMVNLAFSKNVYSRVLASYEALFGQSICLKTLVRCVRLPGALCQQLLSRMEFIKGKGDAFSGGLLIGLLCDVLWALNHCEGASPPVPIWLQQARTAMEKRENFLCGLPRLIELSGKSQEHLNRMMKHYFGQTPTAFINELKLEYAAKLLSETSKQVLDCMYEAGFSNVSYFNQRFQEKYHMPPSRYRAQNNLVLFGMNV